ncbi:hypothetical protein EIN_181470 [Entamoeba invadens IP1]|uniref:hypothetical protein n=1 Tax=Entamoeba invadens IP1 TaxID=370355 RepID=UPI0002C3E410|nr:hypothetical protein EIN_181470 [Entamoeba invadens IP1]ELP93980.1 hypothetical protein EIN_181470 [Entamoeba invadens IP1]|eukprot:XP_004260751.1 hypothetical protein EIN_181470 [Entamoeba invadens IP1]
MENKGVYELYAKQQDVLTDAMKQRQPFSIASETDDDDFWKVVIFDQFNCDLLSLQLRVGEVRKYGVTLMLHIDNPRQPLEDVPAIYFVEPTKRNVDSILSDTKSGKYAKFTICFSSVISDELLDYFATNSAAQHTDTLIKNIRDMYIHYHVLEPHLFTLSMENSYCAFNNQKVDEKTGLENISTVVNSLMSVCVTLREVPIIRARGGSLEDVIARQLTQRLHKFSAANPTFFRRGVSTRPILLITNRNHDISAGLLHGWNYQALIKEVTEYQLNRVLLDGKWEDIETEGEFWKGCKASIIPDVTDAIQKKTKELVTEKEKFQIVANSFGLSFDEQADINTVSEEDKKKLQGQGMAKYGEQMTQIRALKKEIDLHTAIARLVVEQIKQREIDLLFSYEDNVMSGIQVEQEALLNFAARITNTTDLARLFYIYLLNTQDVSALKKVVEAGKVDLKALDYMKKLKQTQEYLHLTKDKKKEVGFASMISMVGKVVQRLIPMDKNMAVTVLVDTLTECKQNELENEYNYYDPRSSTENVVDGRRTIQFKDSIVFVVGGGNYTEFSNIQQYAERNGKHVLYGATEMFGGKELLEQIEMII